MNVLIIGGGKSGSFLAEKLREKHHITVVESKIILVNTLLKKLPDVAIIHGDGCEPSILDKAGASRADLVAALTGDDEDNLVISFLSKFQYRVPLVFARINHPRNEWLFNKSWGVDVAVSSTSIIASLVEEEISLGDIIMLLKLQAENLEIDEVTLPPEAGSVGKTLSQLNFPPQTLVMAVISGKEVKIPRGNTLLQAGDKLLLLSHIEHKRQLEETLGI